VAADASLRAVARGALSASGARLPCPSRDLRRKVRSRPRQALIVFAVDASASMAAGERMSIAKGAAIAILRTAYLRRDRVAVVVFEQETARVLLEPTRSIDRAQERLRALPAGGGTPLPAGLWTARQLIAAERLRDPHLAPTLVLLSDGQSNVPMDAMAYSPREALAVADRIRADGVSVLVVDVATGPASPQALVELAERLGGRLLRVARGDAGAVAAAARSRGGATTSRPRPPSPSRYG
jgi:magnesium chelatase subunit D